jgi:hypothetical protein
MSEMQMIHGYVNTVYGETPERSIPRDSIFDLDERQHTDEQYDRLSACEAAGGSQIFKLDGELYHIYFMLPEDEFGWVMVYPVDGLGEGASFFNALWYNGGAGSTEVIREVIEKHIMYTSDPRNATSFG